MATWHESVTKGGLNGLNGLNGLKGVAGNKAVPWKYRTDDLAKELFRETAKKIAGFSRFLKDLCVSHLWPRGKFVWPRGV